MPTLSRSPVSQAPQEGIGEAECQVAAISSRSVNVRDISSLLQSELSSPKQTISFLEEQMKDPWLQKLFRYLDDGNLPVDDIEARRVLLQSSLFTVYNGWYATVH